MNGNFVPFGLKSVRHTEPCVRSDPNVKNSFAKVTIKMRVFAHVRTKPRGPSLQSHLPDQPALDQRVQTVVNGGHRYAWHAGFGPEKHLLGSRMISFGREQRINMLALRSKTKAAGRKPAI